MCRQIFAGSSLTALALLGALLVPEPAAAQQGWRLYDWSGGWGPSSAGSFYRGGYQDFGYSAPSTFYSMPSYYTFPGFYSNGPITGYPSFYQPRIGHDYGYFSMSTAGNTWAVNRAALINVSVPANAEVSFEGEETAQTGSFRQFISPLLTPGHDYFYDIEVRWVEDGMETSRSRRISVHAGDVVNLSFHSGTAFKSSVP
jgi:uncharacterized protein (TIGR03000 family)